MVHLTPSRQKSMKYFVAIFFLTILIEKIEMMVVLIFYFFSSSIFLPAWLMGLNFPPLNVFRRCPACGPARVWKGFRCGDRLIRSIGSIQESSPPERLESHVSWRWRCSSSSLLANRALQLKTGLVAYVIERQQALIFNIFRIKILVRRFKGLIRDRQIHQLSDFLLKVMII